MKQRALVLFLPLFFALLPAAYAKGVKADAYLGYSHIGANSYIVNTPGLNGWQFALQIRPATGIHLRPALPLFVGLEGDVSHNGEQANGGSETATLVMFGPRFTVDAGHIGIFGHILGGMAHVSSNFHSSVPANSFNAFSFALGGGADFPLFQGLSLRATADFLGDTSNQPSAPSTSPFRVGVGIAYHF